MSLTPEQRAVLTIPELMIYDEGDEQGTPWSNPMILRGRIQQGIRSLADTRIQLAEARRDAERIAWLIARESTHFFPCLRPYDSVWCLNTDEDWFIECGPADKPPAFTPEARTIIDAARAAEEASRG